MFSPPTKQISNTPHQEKKNYGIDATICIGREIQCLPYGGFLIVPFPNKLTSQAACLQQF